MVEKIPVKMEDNWGLLLFQEPAILTVVHPFTATVVHPFTAMTSSAATSSLAGSGASAGISGILRPSSRWLFHTFPISKAPFFWHIPLPWYIWYIDPEKTSQCITPFWEMEDFYCTSYIFLSFKGTRPCPHLNLGRGLFIRGVFAASSRFLQASIVELEGTILESRSASGTSIMAVLAPMKPWKRLKKTHILR